MTGLDHEHSAAIDLAVEWMLKTRPNERGDRAIVPQLRERFGLSALEACQTLREWREQKARENEDQK